MFSHQQKQEIALKVQHAIQQTLNDELPVGEVSFILHVDGAEDWSWANIRNTSARDVPVPDVLVQNMAHLTPGAMDVATEPRFHTFACPKCSSLGRVLCEPATPLT